ncbi:hypothetical protein C8R47DRAFT_1063967 [Mycena vitilis]|nr:hypothetical protein C8R47DRAFT_1063967 [Mycena vitilis]
MNEGTSLRIGRLPWHNLGLDFWDLRLHPKNHLPHLLRFLTAPLPRQATPTLSPLHRRPLPLPRQGPPQQARHVPSFPARHNSLTANPGGSAYIPIPPRALVMEQLSKTHRQARAHAARTRCILPSTRRRRRLVEFATAELARKASGPPKLDGVSGPPVKGKPRADWIRVWRGGVGARAAKKRPVVRCMLERDCAALFLASTHARTTFLPASTAHSQIQRGGKMHTHWVKRSSRAGSRSRYLERRRRAHQHRLDSIGARRPQPRRDTHTEDARASSRAKLPRVRSCILRTHGTSVVDTAAVECSAPGLRRPHKLPARPEPRRAHPSHTMRTSRRRVSACLARHAG